ncbi:MAG TPA: glycerophosphodiester phosphodiesterase [Candidatus Dormibacteraeota bacterium]|nr:glycerophosphodiester phosphodiesterase [Candidatus Dormibacteraeota bacterium]
MFDLQGHRGARGLWPENTLGGFARTLELGVSGIELDCALTRDGVLVVTHDPELNPDCTRDARGRFLEGPGAPIRALSYAQLQAYDVGRLRPGSAYAERFPAQQPLDGERIPRLEDVLTLVRRQAGERVRLALEVKTFPEQPDLTASAADFAEALQSLLARTATQTLVSILAFDWRVLAAAQRLMPAIPRAALTEQQPGEDTVRLTAPAPSPWLNGLDPKKHDGSVPRLVRATGATTWGPDYLDLEARTVAEAHALGLRVVPWTVNESADMERLLAFGVDGMITDRPDTLRALLAAHGRALPELPA